MRDRPGAREAQISGDVLNVFSQTFPGFQGQLHDEIFGNHDRRSGDAVDEEIDQSGSYRQELLQLGSL